MHTNHWLTRQSLFLSTGAAFFILSMFSIVGLFDAIDLAVMDWVYHSAPAFLTDAMTVITAFGSVELIALMSLLVLGLLLYQKRIRDMIFFIAVSGGGLAVNLGLKFLFQRERPGELNMIDAFGIELAIPSYSYPSGHTMRAAILVLLIIYLLGTWVKGKEQTRLVTLAGLVLLTLVAASRVLTGAHFPTDAVGAVLASVAFVSLCARIYEKRWRPSP